MPERLLHFTLGPVQGFVAQARRTRDLWAGSFLLSYLAGHAMKAVLEGGGSITFPDVGSMAKPTDPLLAAILGKPLPDNPTPKIGSLPNRFKAEVPDGFDPVSCRKAVLGAWQRIADAVWQRYVAGAAPQGRGTRAIWERQVAGFWDMSWVMGGDPGDRSDNTWLDRRKNWRTFAPTEEPGDKCTLMGSLQELSGFVRATARGKQTERGNQEDFWGEVRRRVGSLNLGEHERLCAVSLIKRLFPNVASEVIGWELDAKTWPSTSYMAAVPWLERIQASLEAQALALEYPKLVRTHAEGDIFGEYSTDLSCVARDDFTRLDGQLYYRYAIESDKERGFSAEAKRALQAHLGELSNAVGHPPSPFYALLLMDGDSLGKLLQHQSVQPTDVSRALAHFTDAVDGIVRERCGKTVYAGGDDVLALLPLDRALPAATALRQRYQQAFEEVLGGKRPADHPPTTISAGLVFAHYHTSLRAVMQEAHYLLDTVAKDGNGRDSIAVSVLTGSGRTVEWVSSWEERTAPHPVPDIVQDLVRGFVDKDDKDEAQFASKFFYNVRARFEVLTGDERTRRASGHKLPKELDAMRLLVAEYQKNKSRERVVPLHEAEERVKQLLRVCRVRKGGVEDPKTLNVEGAMLVRFLATKGRGVER
ncbi:type III-B CRISPR-associated protein Cas10/Cmr2 [Truepera radiovictrix]|uniref:CRISPR-associated protein, Crm2 family n=1 Tax=Truepera radiovictrix (strain DSM 17093 / CIP 108686 / LMG 22925 / RQ-24) TaxID=649638 RepID=D7CXG8_TRURR|nr:type III-B CRISPR-associated protein Cas10/Cmr2 [Truepera radiovictrix]ADI14570.1 CRISPR-associated protein, Crm2 family [Truepera radiovictrix DSM 17093]WMT56880.1 type III-B CRISPR-associated protein Cas10/Cmr2 [Truepera radiovictrix]